MLLLLLGLLLPLFLLACGEEAITPTAPATTAARLIETETASPEVTAPVTTATSPTTTTVAAPVGPTGTAASVAIASPAPTRSAAAPTATATLPPGTPFPASTAGVPPSPTAVGAIKAEQQILNLIGGDVESFDPALGLDTGTAFILRQLYSGLVTLDNNLNVVPDLAARMPELSENSTLYTFKLREGAKFQSGREITAEDFKFSLERAADPKLAAPELPTTLPAATYMIDIVGVKDKLDGKVGEISGVRVKDKYTLQIKLDAAKPYFLAKMSFGVFFVVNKEAVAKGFEEVDGSGPFKLAEYRREQFMKLARNDNYYFGPPRLRQVNFVLGANASNSLGLYEQGKLDLTYLGGADVERALDRNNPLSRELVIKPQLKLNYLGFNTKAKPFDDPKVRQAFSIVIDRPRIARAMFENKVQPAISILPPGLPGYTGKAGPLNYDISRARDLITQSSYRSPANLPRITVYSTGDSLSRVLQETYKQAFGIDLDVRYYDFKDFQSGLSQRQFQMYLYAWVADYPDPENFLRSLLASGSAFNDSGYNNNQFDDLLKQGDQQNDPAKRLALYAQAEQLALGDAPLLPIYHEISYMLLKPYVKGLVMTGAGIWTLKDVYILK